MCIRDRQFKNKMSSPEDQKYIAKSIQDIDKVGKQVKTKYEELMRIQNVMTDSKGFTEDKISDTLTMYYKRGENSVTMRLEADLDINIFNLFVLVYEADLYKSFMPFVEESQTIQKVDKTSKVVYTHVRAPYPVKDRITCMVGFGINRIDHNGTVVLVCKSCSMAPDLVETFDLKPPEISSKHVEVKVKLYGCEFQPISEEKTRIRVISDMDPQMTFLPEVLLQWLTRKVGVIACEKLIAKAKDLTGTPWETRLKEDPEGIYDWIRGQVQKFFKNTPTNSLKSHL
eukprot:TRINITY_DN22253_c0_g1_i1.p1 TRINITY_DN22253_c0_g1~~TRINITY_DN22253_c0_g1_i1.p1  ORF type:complete len:285 (+),score=47.52 TRINITY_DN22253_c0_g1_i1:64-918(+)